MPLHHLTGHDPLLSTVYLEGASRSLTAAWFWEHGGHLVDVLKVAISEAALAIRVDLDDSDRFREYRYIVCLYYSTGARLVVFLDPAHSLVDVSNDSGGAWTWIGELSGAYYGATSNTASVVILLADLDVSRQGVPYSRLALTILASTTEKAREESSSYSPRADCQQRLMVRCS